LRWEMNPERRTTIDERQYLEILEKTNES